MDRRAILIAAGNVPGQVPLPGCDEDVRALRQFLRSRLGGAWHDYEIVTLIDPTAAEVMAALVLASEADYLFISFSGHGAHPRGTVDQLRTRLQLADERIGAYGLQTDVERGMILIDSCRTVLPIVEEVEQYVEEHVKVAAKLADRNDFRRAFDAAIAKTPESLNYVFACSIGEKSADHPQLGSAFIHALVAQAYHWDAKVEGWNRAQRLPEAIFRAYSVIRDHFNQFPVLTRNIEHGAYFPFAIHLD